MSGAEVAYARKRYGRINGLFWLGVLGVFLGPVAALVLAVIAFKLAGSGVSAPIGLSAPFWSIASLALALLVRSSRKEARRSKGLAEFADSHGLAFEWKPPKETWKSLAELAVWSNPTSMKASNLILGAHEGTNFQIVDFRHEHFYGAVTWWSEQTLIVFPNALNQDFQMQLIPMGLADKFLQQFSNSAAPLELRDLAIAQQCHISVNGSMAPVQVRQWLAKLTPLFRQEPKLCLIVEGGHLILFKELTLLDAKNLQQMLATAWSAWAALR